MLFCDLKLGLVPLFHELIKIVDVSLLLLNVSVAWTIFSMELVFCIHKNCRDAVLWIHGPRKGLTIEAAKAAGSRSL